MEAAADNRVSRDSSPYEPGSTCCPAPTLFSAYHPLRSKLLHALQSALISEGSRMPRAYAVAEQLLCVVQGLVPSGHLVVGLQQVAAAKLAALEERWERALALAKGAYDVLQGFYADESGVLAEVLRVRDDVLSGMRQIEEG